jgi:hypothetical protein
MLRMNYWAVVVAAVAAFVVGAVWYSLLFGDAYIMLRGIDPDAMANMRPPAGEMLGEFVRCLVVAFVLARFVVRLGVDDWDGALRLGLWVWIGFQATLIVGAVIHENMPWKLYAIHAGDALVKTLFMAVILGVWRRRTSSAEQGA